MMTPNERMREVERYAQMTPSALARHIGLKQNQTIYNIHHRGINISIALSKKITAAFPQIDARWLLTGEGDMLVEGYSGEVAQVEASSDAPADVEEVQALPIVDMDIMKQRDVNAFNYVGDNYDRVNKLRLGQLFENTDLVISTYNESMTPNILPTDYLFIQRLNNPKHKIKEGEVYYIDTKNMGGLVRRCYYGSEAGVIEGRADNAALYPTVLIEEDDINDVGVILGSFRFVIPSGLACGHEEQLRESSAHISSLIEQIDKSGERVDKLIDLLAKKE